MCRAEESPPMINLAKHFHISTHSSLALHKIFITFRHVGKTSLVVYDRTVRIISILSSLGLFCFIISTFKSVATAEQNDAGHKDDKQGTAD